MALVPSAAYPGQTAVDANYPQGKARDVTVSGDGTGTPLEKNWVNDIWGFEQALLAAGGVTPSGTPDSVAASDYLTALRALFGYAQSVLSTSALATGSTVGLGALSPNVGGFTLVGSNAVQVPAAGDYLITLTGEVIATVATQVNLFLNVGGTTVQELSPQCTSTIRGLFAFECMVTIATPSTQKISVVETFSAGTATIDNGLLIVRRLGR